MKKNKSLKILMASAILASGVLMASPSTLASKNFTDLNDDPTHAISVNYLNTLDIFDYKSGSKLNGNVGITRAEVSKILHNLYKDEIPPVRTYINNLTDLNSKTPFYEDVIWSYESGIFDGDSTGKFNPNQTLTRAQMAKVLVNTFLLTAEGTSNFNDVSKNHWAYEYINILGSTGISIGDGKGKFLPNNKVTLNQLSTFIYRIINKYSVPSIDIDTSTDNSNNSISENMQTLNPQVDMRIQEIKQQYNALKPRFLVDMYDKTPSTVSPYSLGTLKKEVLQDALNATNLIRFIAHLPSDITLNETFNTEAQAAAVVNAANNKLTHYPTKPQDMAESMFSVGSNGAKSSNLGMGYSSIVQSIVYGYMEDGDVSNIDRVGHRLWILSPKLEQVGFGFVDVYGTTYTAMKVIDSNMYNNASIDYDFISWPAHTAMPTEYITSEFPWSVSLNTDKYDSTKISEVQVQLVRLTDNKTWNFSSGQSDGYFNFSTENYGYLPYTIIFRPDEKPSYQPHDRYRVTISNLTESDGQAATIEFETTFFTITE